MWSRRGGGSLIEHKSPTQLQIVKVSPPMY
jgi:hypothetical protein